MSFFAVLRFLGSKCVSPEQQRTAFSPAPEFDGKAKNYTRFKWRFEEMGTPNFEDRLPEAEQLEYIKRAKSYQGSDFDKLKIFLVERKQEEEMLRKLGTGARAM